MHSEFYSRIWVGPGLVHSPCCPWIGFGHWDRADLASAQGPVGRAGKLHGDGWRKTFIERAARSQDLSPCSGYCLSSLAIVPRLAVGSPKPGTTSTPSHSIAGAAFLAGPGTCSSTWGWPGCDWLQSVSPVQHGSPSWLLWDVSGQQGKVLHYSIALQTSPGHP